MLLCALLMTCYVYLMKIILKRLIFRSTAVDGLVKVVYVLMYGDGLAIVEFLLFCSDDLVKVALLLFNLLLLNCFFATSSLQA